MTDTPDMPSTPNGAGTGDAKRWPLIAGIAVIVAALIAVLFVTGGDDDSSVSVPSNDATAAGSVIDTSTTADATVENTDAPTTTEPPATTEALATTEPATAAPTATEPATTEVAPPPDEIRPAIWPWADTDTRYTDPVAAATGLATEFLGFDEPIVGEFMAGDNRSGEVEIRAFETGPVTVVFVRQLTADDTWWILGAAGANITVDEPEAAAEITSPLTVSGTASAFEGTVDVELRADGNGEPILEGFVTASGGMEPGPFSKSFEFTSPGETGGALVMLSLSPKDGSVFEATVLRIFYR